MKIIHICTVKKISKRPYSINLMGSIEHSSFNADLEGACLNIKSPHPLSEDEEQTLKEKLRELFPLPLGGKFMKKDINKVLSDNNGTISITV